VSEGTGQGFEAGVLCGDRVGLGWCAALEGPGVTGSPPAPTAPSVGPGPEGWRDEALPRRAAKRDASERRETRDRLEP